MRSSLNQLAAAAALLILAACNGGTEFGPSSPGTGPGVGTLDLTGVWYESPNPYDWPATVCDGGLNFNFCLAGRFDATQNGNTATGTHLCYDSGRTSDITATFSTSASGTAVQEGCGPVGCWSATYTFWQRADGAVVWKPERVEVTTGPATGAQCTGSGTGLAYREATTVPAVAGYYDYFVNEETGTCPDCGDSFTNVFYVLQDEASLTGVIPDTVSGVLVYDVAIDASGSGSYALATASASPCSTYTDTGLINFSAGQVSINGTYTCDGCWCDYTASGIRR